MSNLHFSTKVIHTSPSKKDPHGALHVPVYNNAAFEFETSEDIALAFSGKKPAHSYSRVSNPTVEYLELQLKNITGAFAVTAVASGMAAISNAFITVAQQGNNIVTSPHLFGNTYSLFSQTFQAFGIEVRFCDLTNISEIESKIDVNTCAIFFETITNPQLEVVDIPALSKIAAKHNVLLIADTTATPPYFFNAKKYGIGIEIISCTKFISGGGTSIGGLIVDYGTYDWTHNKKLQAHAEKHGQGAFNIKLRREVYKNLGACLSPENAYLQSLGLETLALRTDKCCENTLQLAQWLSKQTKVKLVNFPGLENSKYYTLTKSLFNGKFGSLLTFDLTSQEQCFRFMDNLKLIRRATNLQDNKTLIIHPYTTIYCDNTPEEKQTMGIADTMMRLSVGIEYADDLIADIQQALDKI